MGPSSGGLSFSLFVPARFGTLDERAKFHQVMRCCPSCGSSLVLFREKFGEVAGRSPPGSVRAPPGKGPPGGAGPGGGENLLANGGLTGGWVCTKCGVHIIPNDKSQSNPTSPDSKHHGSGGRGNSGNSPDRNRPRSGSRPGSREASPHTRPGGSPHQGAPQSPHGNKGDNPSNMVNGSSSAMSPKAPVIIDDDYEIWERQVKHSFTSFLNQIRERLGSKEMSLKQYQVTLCQRERQLRSNEENMQHRWNKVKQSEQNFRTKMDRLNLYKETMIHQLEAKAKQLTQYEQRLRTMDFRTSSHDVRGSTHDVKGSTLDFRLSDPPADVQNTSVTSGRNTSVDGGKEVNKDLWNSSVNSDVQNTAFVSQNQSPRTTKSPTARDGHSGPLADHRPKVGVTMVKPTVDYRKPPISASGETRGSQNALARDFRPSGASSANINQIYTRDTSSLYTWSKPSGQPQAKPSAVNKNVHYPESSNYLYRKPQQTQKPLSPPMSRNGSTYDVRQAYFARQPEGAPVRKTSGSDVKHSGSSDVRQSGTSDVRHSGSSDVRHSGRSDMTNLPSDVRLSGDSNIRHTAAIPDARPINGDVRFSRSDVRRPVDITQHRSPPRTTALPPQQKPPMPLKSALKSPDSGTSQRWSTQTNLHVTTTEPQVVTSFVDHDNLSLSPSERERSVSGLSDLSPTYTTSGYASDRENSMNGGGGTVPGKKTEKHNVSFDDMISTSSPQSSVERDTRPPWMKRRSRRLTEV